MNKFCTSCNNVLYMVTRPDSFTYYCNTCAKTYVPEDRDTMLYDYNKNTDTSIHRNLLYYAGRDPVNQKEFKICEGCGHNIATQIRIGDNMILVSTCVKCGNQWKG